MLTKMFLSTEGVFSRIGVVPSSIESIDDLCQLPVCRKKDLKECVLADRVVGHARLDRMPFIRYCPGDLCELYFETCDCGRTGPTIRNIQGREDDFLTMRDGRLVSPMISIKPLFDLDCLNQYRVIQESFEGYRIEYSGVRELTVAERMRIRAHFETTLGADDVCFERYAELPRDSSGKLRKIVSRISDPHSFS